MKKIFTILLIFVAFQLSATNYYLSPTGDDTTGDGSIGDPWLHLEKAWTVVSAGDTIYMRGGTYDWDDNQNLTGASGTSGNYIYVFAYQSELPVITRGSSFVMTSMIYVSSSNYLYFKGLEISYIEEEVGEYPYSHLAFQDCNNCIWENISYHHNSSGAWFRGDSDGNLVYNCDFHHNYDPYRDGDPYGGADGLNISYIDSGHVNTIRGCRFWNNADDGLDIWENDGNQIIDSCWSWNNGYREDGTTTGGDGVGLKLGKTVLTDSTTFNRTVTNNLVFLNRQTGINQNAAICKMYIYNNTMYDNVIGIYFSGSWGNSASLIRNNIAYDNGTNANITQPLATIDHNSWSGYTVTDGDFVSVDTTGISGARQSDGSLPDIDFLTLVSGSDLVDGGIDVGLPYEGTAPDLGYYEYVEPPPLTNTTVANNRSVVKSNGKIVKN